MSEPRTITRRFVGGPYDGQVREMPQPTEYRAADLEYTGPSYLYVGKGPDGIGVLVYEDGSSRDHHKAS